MTDAAVDWSSVLSDLGVPGVPGVPAQKSATFDGTPSETLGVPGGRVEHLGTPLEHLAPLDKSLNTIAEHLGTPGTPNIEAGGLADDLRAGVRKLSTMHCPRVQRPELWDEIKADVVAICNQNWAAQAMALGWEPLQIFGYQPSDVPNDFSLAVELAGRFIVAVDESRFYLRQGDVRSFFERRERPLLTRYLWDFDQ